MSLQPDTSNTTASATAPKPAPPLVRLPIESPDNPAAADM